MFVMLEKLLLMAVDHVSAGQDCEMFLIV